MTAPKVSDVIFRRGRKVRQMLRDMLALILVNAASAVATDEFEDWFFDVLDEVTEPKP